MKQHKNAMIIVAVLVILIIILWKCVYPKKKDESGYLYLDGSWYVNEPWQDSWPNQ